MVEEIIGCKWSLSVMSCVRKGIVRPGAMERSIAGVSTKVLNQRLRRFIAFGILEKRVHRESPPRVEYELTDFGEQFVRVIDVVDELQQYIDQRSAR